MLYLSFQLLIYRVKLKVGIEAKLSLIPCDHDSLRVLINAPVFFQLVNSKLLLFIFLKGKHNMAEPFLKDNHGYVVNRGGLSLHGALAGAPIYITK